ncbi:MAG: carboxypeptidase-like regulatory domain-containing protein [ANME-2 cluster archaeon]|nr:carboxypeptidase-like regulatory domain-containing protein [ANME-2 cluster archaeon]
MTGMFTSTAAAYESIEIIGTVTSNGVGVPSAVIEINSIQGVGTEEEKMLHIGETVTDENGNFSFKTASISQDYLVNVSYQDFEYHSIVKMLEPYIEMDLSGEIRGTVSHGTDKRNMGGITVKLMDIYEIASTVTNDGGVFSFDNVNVNVIGDYHTVVSYKDVAYTGIIDFMSSNSSEMRANVSINVFESTISDDVINVVQDHVILSQEPSGVWVDEIVVFKNVGTNTFFNPDRAWLGIPLPPNVINFHTDYMACCVTKDDGVAWIDPMEPMMPGDTLDVKISYQLDSADTSFTFTKNILYDTSGISILAPVQSGLDIESSTSVVEDMSVGGNIYRTLTLMDLKTNAKIQPLITGINVIPSDDGGITTGKFIIILAVLGAIGAVSYPFLKKHKILGKHEKAKKRHPNAYPTRSFSELNAEKMAVFRILQKIDFDLENGLISEDEYETYREIYEQRAEDAIMQMNEMIEDIDLTLPVDEISEIVQHVDDLYTLVDIANSEMNGEKREEVIKMIEKRISELKAKMEMGGEQIE